MKYFFIAILFLLVSNNTFSQNTITGKVVDEKNQAVELASVRADSMHKTKTDIDGKFELKNIGTGKQTLTVKMQGYTTKELELDIQENSTVDLTISLERSTKKMKEAVVKSSVKKESVNAIINFQKNNITVSDGVSAEAIKRTPDRNVSDVLKRASGMSIQGDKFAVIRGMDGRYVNAMINNTLLPSTEPDRKAFAFDLIPSNIVDNVIVTKAAVPELTGEFAGGIINLNLKEGVDKNFTNLSIGTGFNSQTLTKDFTSYNGGKADFLGFDNSTRQLPSVFPDRNEYIKIYNSSSDTSKYGYSKIFDNNWTYNTKKQAIPNLALQFNGGFSNKIAGKKLNSIFSISYNNNYRTTLLDNLFINPNNDSLYTYLDKQYSNKVQWGVLANFSYNIGKSSKIMLKNLFNINSNNQTTIREGRNIQSANDVRKYELFFVSNRLYNTQLQGEHKLKKADIKLKWGLNYSNVNQNTPDRRVMEYTRDMTDTSVPYQAFISTTANPLFAGRFYSKLNENLKSGNIDLSKDFKMFEYDQKVKIGAYIQERNRTFNVRNLGMAVSSLATYLNPNINFSQTADLLFANENIAQNGFVLAENTNKEDAYNGETNLNAFYVQLENQFSEKIKLVWGVRNEMFKQSLNGIYVDSQFVNTSKNDFLPSAVLTFSPNKKTNFRLCASQTVVRPEFRELAPFQFYDFERNSYVQGNTKLERSKINNFEARYEYYPAAGEMFVLGSFYKNFKNPIQPNLDIFSGGTFVRSFYNAINCTNFGVETEFRKKLEKVGTHKLLKEGSIFANATYTYSKVIRTDDSGEVDKTTQLVNQSPFILNIGYTYMQPEVGWGFTAVYNLLTRRISEVGVAASNVPDIIEATRHVVDAQISYRTKNNKSEIKLNAGDLLNQRNIFFMDIDGDYKYNSSTDYLVFKRTLGRNISIQYNLKF